MGLSKIRSPKKSASFEPFPPLSLFVTNISSPLPPFHRSKVTVFADKLWVFLSSISLSFIFIKKYHIPDFHFRTFKWTKHNWLVLQWHQLDVRCYVNFKIQKFCFEKILYIWLERRRGYFCRRFFAKAHIGTLQANWEVLCKIAEGSC